MNSAFVQEQAKTLAEQRFSADHHLQVRTPIPPQCAKYEVRPQHEGATSIEWMRVPRFISNPIDRDATTSDATNRIAKAIDPRQSAIVTALTRVSASGGVANPSHTVAASAITASNGTTRTEKYANS